MVTTPPIEALPLPLFSNIQVAAQAPTVFHKLPLWALAVMAGMFGLVVGSFLNVVALRGLKGESFCWPGSHCPSCKTPLHWWENIPVGSWLVLRGACRTCQTSISPQYPLVELATGLLFILAAWVFGPAITMLAVWWLMSNLVVATITDLKEQVIFDFNSLAPIPAGLVAVWVSNHVPMLESVQLASPILAVPGLEFLGVPVWSAVVGALLGAALFEAAILITRWTIGQDGFGHGDSLLMASLGAYLGWERTLVAFGLSFLVQAAFALPFLLLKWWQAKYFKRIGWLVLALVGASMPLWVETALLGGKRSMLALLGAVALTLVASIKFLADVANINPTDEAGGYTTLPMGPAIIVAGLAVLLTTPLWKDWLPAVLRLT
jgi:leader peptidase (prepilin peptidase) / N-methyltransferase